MSIQRGVKNKANAFCLQGQLFCILCLEWLANKQTIIRNSFDHPELIFRVIDR